MDKKLTHVLILGAIAGVLAVTPSISTWINTQLTTIIPPTWMFMGTWTLALYGAVAGAIVGVILYKQR